MVEGSRCEYSVKTCPSDEPSNLEDLLNEMSEKGWDLYMLNESESKKGGGQYNCIFYREIDNEEFENDDIVDVDNFATRMEKMLNPSDEPYEECRELQARIYQKQEELAKIKSLLDSTISSKEHETLNEELSKNLTELNMLKSQLIDSIEPNRMFNRINQDKLTIIISNELVDLVETQKDGELISETVNLRQKLADELGYVIPAIRFTDSDTLESHEYRIDVRGIKVSSGFIYPGYCRFYPGQSNLARKPKGAIGDIDPITGESVFWIEKSKTRDFWEKGLTSAQVIVNNLEYIVCRYVNEILDYSDINNYIEIVGNQNLYLIQNLFPGFLSVSDLRYVLAGLIRERVSIKDLIYIFERLNDFAPHTTEKEILLMKSRIALGRQICSNIADINNNIYGIEIAENLVNILEDLLIHKLDREPYFEPKDPEIGKLIKKIISIIKNSEYDTSNIAIIAPMTIRLSLFLLFEQFIPALSVISPNEIATGFNLEIIKSLNKI